MIDEKIEVKIGRDVWKGTVGIQFRSRRDGRVYIAEPVQLVFKERETGKMYEPTLEFHEDLADQFLKGMAEALDANGVKTENDHVMAGKLKAMESHMSDVRDHYEDMRSIVNRVIQKEFLKPPGETL